MDIIRRNQKMGRMNKDIHRLREQIDTLKGKLASRMIERTNFVSGEMYDGGE